MVRGIHCNLMMMWRCEVHSTESEIESEMDAVHDIAPVSTVLHLLVLAQSVSNS